jgi:sodium/potassium-transporting ATPase subunit alpha
MLGIIDKPREGIDEVIATCKGAGIRVFMVTGDFSVTAAAIAKQIGIFSSDCYDTLDTMRVKAEQSKNLNNKDLMLNEPHMSSLLLTGVDMLKLEETDWRNVTKYDEIVFARTSPSQKLEIVENLQKDKNIVAVTGDGVNDSPALKRADIGNNIILFFIVNIMIFNF